jgi:anti-sigma factor RsiW
MACTDMPCTDKKWTEKLDAYLDGELPAADERRLSEHLRTCAECAAGSLSRLQQKRLVQSAGRRFTPDPAFRARIQQSIAYKPRSHWGRMWIPALAGAMALLIVGALFVSINRSRAGERQLLGELTDLHVATLASSNPLDVVSSDRHTVKPWFTGKIPFTFNLPELQNTPFTLLGARMSYLHQSPGVELIFQVRQHRISIFIFQERALGNHSLAESVNGAPSFNARSWTRDGLCYFAISDVSEQDLEKLAELMKAAG